jgi:hypothetical protein
VFDISRNIWQKESVAPQKHNNEKRVSQSKSPRAAKERATIYVKMKYKSGRGKTRGKD